MTKEKKEMLHDILSTYTFDTKTMYDEYNLGKTPDEIIKDLNTAKSSAGGASTTSQEIEDDDILFGGSGKNNDDIKVTSPDELEADLDKIVDDWFD